MADNPSIELLARVRAGDEQAADELFQRFAERLVAVASARLSAKLARRVDAEDVVQSAYRSFFVNVRDGRYALQRSGDLWRLLVGITINKVQHQAEHHTAGKRSIGKEQQAAEESGEGLAFVALAREPNPFEAAALTDEVESLLRQLEPHHRPILELRLQGANQAEIAAELQCSERTVRRVLESVKSLLAARNR
jgi:RNA polymerase sigma factor (sigma-70 family)